LKRFAAELHYQSKGTQNMATTTTPRIATPVKLSIQLKKNVKKEQVNALLERIYGLAGCPTCGLNGFDLQLVSNPVINPIVKNLVDAQLDGIAGVSQRGF
jgi:hypothetical protein